MIIQTILLSIIWMAE